MLETVVSSACEDDAKIAARKTEIILFMIFEGRGKRLRLTASLV